MNGYTEAENINTIAGGGRTYVLAADTAYTGAQGDVIGLYPTAAGAEFTVLSNYAGDDLRPQMGLSSAMTGQAPLHKPPQPVRNVTCSVECVLILANRD